MPRPRRISPLWAGALIVAGCARHGGARHAAAPPRAQPVEVALHVTNHHWLDMTISLEHDGQRTRVGSVTAATSAEFVLPLRMFGVSREFEGIKPTPWNTLYVVTMLAIRAPAIRIVRPLASLRWSNWMTYSRFTVTASPFHVMFSPWCRLTPVTASVRAPPSLLTRRPRTDRTSGPIVRARWSAPVSVMVAERYVPGVGSGVASGW